MVGLTLRALRPGDVVALHASCWPDQRLEAITTLVSDVLRRTERNLAWGLVAVVGGELVGYGQLARWGRLGEISDLMITPALRGQGIGKAIIQQLIHQSRQVGIQQLEIGVQSTNFRALSLYQWLGFVEQRRTIMQLGNEPEAVILLAIDLTTFSESA